MVFCLGACGEKGKTDSGDKVSASSEDYFEWTGDVIRGLSDEGAKQTSLVIPARCEGFDGMIFMDKENSVTSVSFESDEDINLNGVFGGAEQLTDVELPSGLESLGIQEFWYCTGLESIAIPASVKEIGPSAFQSCTGLKDVTIEGAPLIDEYAFDGCTALENLTLPDSVEAIEKYAFYNCAALQNVTLPKNLTVLREFAFSNTGIVTVNVPEEMALTDFDTTCFAQGNHETEVHVTEGS